MRRLTAEKRNKLKRLGARPDREIDLSDIPEIQELPSDAVIGKFYRPKKESVTFRIVLLKNNRVFRIKFHR